MKCNCQVRTEREGAGAIKELRGDSQLSPPLGRLRLQHRWHRGDHGQPAQPGRAQRAGQRLRGGRLAPHLRQLDGLLRPPDGRQHSVSLDLDCASQEDVHERATRGNWFRSGRKGD